MKHLILLLSTLISFTLTSQEVSTYPGLPTTNFNSLDIHDNYVIAMGSCDYIWTSKNGGADWETQFVGYLSLTGVKIIPSKPTTAIMVVDGMLSLFDMDEGIVEIYDETDLNRSIRKVEIINDEIYVCNKAGLYKSSTSNIEWIQVWESDLDDSNSPATMDATDDFIYITTYGGQLIKFNKADQSVVNTITLDDNMTELSMGTNTHGVGVISGMSKPVRTTDGWETYSVLEKFPFGRNMHASGENNIFLVLGTTFQVSSDGGETVIEKLITNNKQINNIRNGFYKDGSVYIYGEGTTFAMTQDNGDSWIVPNPIIRSDLNVVDINNNGLGYAGGQHGYMVKTTDHGNTWEKYDLNLTFENSITGIAVLGNNDLILITPENIRIIRDDVVISEQAVSALRLYKDPNDDFMLCEINAGNSQYQITRSVDGGMTWTKVLDLPKFTSQINVGDNGYLYIVTNNGTSFHWSTDGGLSWDTLDIALDVESLNVIDGTWFVSGSNSLYRSEDEGQNWVKIISAYLVTLPKKGADGNLYATSSANNVTTLHFSINDGEGWHAIWYYCSPSNQFILNQEGKFVITHAKGHVNLFPRPIMSSIVKETELIDKDHFYPNPINSGGALYFKSTFNNASLLDLNGTVVKHYSEPNEMIGLPVIASGSYLIRYEIEGRLFNKLIVVL